MYERFFNLNETPFSIAPNPHYLYMSQQHNEALAHLIYGVGRDGGFVLLTGEVGTGKTTICRCFLEQIPEGTDVAFVLNPKVDVDELLATICDELSIPYISDTLTLKDYIDHINSFLLQQHSEGRHTVLIIDEAQNLSADVLEQIRLLTNLETHEKKLLQIILLGQPELQDMFQRSELRQLSQRVTARFHLSALKEAEIGPYVYHRLSVAGSMDPKSVFPAQTIRRLFQISKGIPRIINLVCDRSLLGAYAKETRVIDPSILNAAAREVLGYKIYSPAAASSMPNWKWLPAVAGGMAGGLLMFMLFAIWIWGFGPAPEQQDGVTSRAVAMESEADSESDPDPSDGEPLVAEVVIEKDESNSGQQPKQNSVESVPPPSPADVEPISATSLLSMQQVFERSSHWEEAQAYADLFEAWGLEYEPQQDGSACRFAEGNGLACLSKLGSLGSVKHYGLPAILRLYNDQGDERYVAIRYLDDSRAQIFVDGEVEQVNLEQLDQYWRGHFSLVWKKPKDYFGPMQPGTIAPLSKWLSYQLDVWENKADPAQGRSSYDDELVERVRTFQRQVGEADDGVVGSGTLIQLTRRIDDTVPSLSDSKRGT